MTGPAENLENTTLDTGWFVEKKLTKKAGSTGGWFSTGYLVSHPELKKNGFLKAIDYSTAFGVAPDKVVDEVQRLTNAYVFERDICIKCRESGVTRVVHAIEHGSIGTGLLDLRVNYLIFERADCDVRSFMDDPDMDLTFALRTLHAIAAALQQMHQAQMAHQDLKPSNVLVFEASRTSKLGDLGRAWARGMPAPHDGAAIAGDVGYAPLELRAGVTVPDDVKRFGYDMHLLGSMVVFLFTRVSINALVNRYLSPTFTPNATTTYEQCLPYYQAAFADALEEFAANTPDFLRERLKSMVRELCNPDYRVRGNPVSVGLTRYALNRYVSLFDLLSYHAATKGKERK